MLEWILPQNTDMGVLDLLDTHLYYDMPLLFTCKDTEGNQFIGLAVDFEEGVGTWLFLPVSAKRMEVLYNHQLDFISAILGSESGTVWIASREVEGHWQAQSMSAESVQEDYLPNFGMYLDRPELS